MRGLPKLSVVVCTAARPDKLQALLDSFTALLVPPAFAAELIVVNNRPDTDIAPIVAEVAGRLPLTVKQLSESKRGLGHARNKGLAHTDGEIIAFTDDDCLVDRCWLLRIGRCFADDPDLMGLGGRVELFDPADSPITVLRGTSSNFLSSHEQVFGFLHGCNMAFRRRLFEQIGYFDTRFGIGSLINSGDDSEFLYRAYQAGCRIRYEPRVLVHHNHGRRSRTQVRCTMTRYHLANGAILAKHAQAGDVNARNLLKNIAARPLGSLRDRPYSASASLRACYHFGSYALGALRYWFFSACGLKG